MNKAVRIKKITALILSSIMLIGCVTACGNGGSDELPGLADESVMSGDEDNIMNGITGDGNGISIVTTIFPEYDWVREIMGDKLADADVVMLLDNGVDLHSFQPTAQDILRIGTCDLFIYVGGESDEWVGDALKEAVNKDMKVLNLLEVLGDNIRIEELVEGMEAEDEGEDEAEGSEDDENEWLSLHEYDEHVWLSLKNAQIICAAIAEAIAELDPDNTEIYKANVDEYNGKLAALDNEYRNAVDNAEKSTLLFGDRFPFRYMVEDYGLSYYAAFTGCSAETEASFETITFLSGKVDELGLTAICTLEETDDKIAETIRGNTETKDQNIVEFNSLQSTTSKDVIEGATYLSVMEDNLSVLEQALR